METDASKYGLKVAGESLRHFEGQHKALLASKADYVYSVKFRRNRSAITAHGAGCEVITGFTRDEFAADPALWYRMIHEEDRVAVMQYVTRIMTADAPLPLEHRIIHKTGGVRWVRNVPFPQRNRKGRVISYDGLISDITDRKEAELDARRTHADLVRSGEDLRASALQLKAKAEKLKATELELVQAAKLECIGRMAAGVAHEVKNPLQTILMGMDFLTHNIPARSDEINEAMRDILQATLRASSIIQGLLELAADTKYQTQLADLNECVEHALQLVHYELEARQTTVLRAFAANLPKVPVDFAKLEQALINLFINAVQAMPRGGALTVRTYTGQFARDLELPGPAFSVFHQGDHLVVIEVRDSGPGVPADFLPRIFDPFFSTKPPQLGAGLGLSVVKKIVELHNGAIDVRNAPGTGAVVTLGLRVKQENAS